MKTLQEQFLTFELAMKLKNIEFDEPCLAYYIYDKDGKFESDFYYHKLNVDCKWNPLCKNSLHPKVRETDSPRVSTPLWQQSFDWFRDNYHFDSSVGFKIIDNTRKWNYTISTKDGELIESDYEFISQVESNTKRLIKLIQLVIRIQRTKPPYISDDFQIGPDGAFEDID